MKKKLIQTYTIMAIFALLLTGTTSITKAENNFNLEITNVSNTTFNFSDQQLLAMPKTTVTAHLYCDGTLVTSGNWAGVRLSYLLNETQVASDISSVQFSASDGYKVYIPYEVALQPETIIAYEKDGEPLIEQLRLILPGSNGAAWIALITAITVNTSGANYPEGVSVGGGKILQMIPNPGTPTPPPTITEPQSTTPVNSSNSQVALPANATAPNQPILPQQVSKNTEPPLELVFLIVAFVSIVILVITGYKVYEAKNSAKNPQLPNSSKKS